MCSECLSESVKCSGKCPLCKRINSLSGPLNMSGAVDLVKELKRKPVLLNSTESRVDDEISVYPFDDDFGLPALPYL